MSIPPVSSLSAVFGVQQAQNQGVPKHKPGATQQATDTVSLSPAALAHLQGGDADHDGDSH